MTKYTKTSARKTSRTATFLRYPIFLLILQFAATALQGQAELSAETGSLSEYRHKAAPISSTIVETDGQTHSRLPQPKLLLPDGFNINWLGAELVKHPKEDRWFLQFDKNSQHATNDNGINPPNPASRELSAKPSRQNEKPDPFDAPMEILPCRWLVIMTHISKSQPPKKLSFRIKAETTTYRNRNFVLPRDVHTLDLFGKNDMNMNKNTNSASHIAQMSTSSSTGTDTMATALQDDPNEKSGSRNKLRDTLMQIPRPQPLDRLEAGRDPDAHAMAEKKSYLVGGSSRSDLREGALIIDRVGRLAYNPETRQWLFNFEADGLGLTEPPVAIHPNRLLQKMEELSYQKARALKFRVSGQISKSQNSNYLLLRKMLIVTDGGNLGK